MHTGTHAVRLYVSCPFPLRMAPRASPPINQSHPTPLPLTFPSVAPPRPRPQGPLVSWTSYFVVCTVVSKPQLLAVMARIEKAAEEDWGRAKQNSPGSSPWEVLDFGDGACTARHGQEGSAGATLRFRTRFTPRRS